VNLWALGNLLFRRSSRASARVAFNFALSRSERIYDRTIICDGVANFYSDRRPDELNKVRSGRKKFQSDLDKTNDDDGLVRVSIQQPVRACTDGSPSYAECYGFVPITCGCVSLQCHNVRLA
jgi:hypothetical protein